MIHLPSLYSECIVARWKVPQMHICKRERDRKDKRHQVYKSTNWKGVLRNRRVRCISGAIITEKSSIPILKTYEMYLCMHVHVYSCIWKSADAMVHVWKLETNARRNFLLPPCGFRRWNSALSLMASTITHWAILWTRNSNFFFQEGIPIFNAVTMFKNYRIKCLMIIAI